MYKKVFPVIAECKLLHKDAKLPSRQRTTDAAYDVYTIEDAIIPAHGMKNVDTGIIVSVPPGYYFTVDARSSLGKQGIIPMRGIIDATYTGPLMVILTNQTGIDYAVHKGDRVAQIILHEQSHMEFKLVDEFSPEYNVRGTNGWGSSGR